MIAFDLCCDNGHAFEAWFHDGRAVDDLANGVGLPACPVCGSEQVRKVPSAIAIRKGRGGDGGDSSEVLLRLVERVREAVERHTEDVGPTFTTEALKMHYGVVEPRGIRGVASAAQEKLLKEEGISFFKLPVPDKGPTEGH